MTEATRQRTCEERIAEQLLGRVEDFRAYVKAYDLRDDDEEGGGEDLTDEEARIVSGFYEVEEARRELAELSPTRLEERIIEELQELALSVETRRVVDVCLSTGGPADCFEFWMDSEGDIDRIWYVFKDWFDGARRKLEGKDFETVKRIAELAGWTEVYG